MIVKQILLVSTIGNLLRTLWRKSILMSGCNGLTLTKSWTWIFDEESSVPTKSAASPSVYSVTVTSKCGENISDALWRALCATVSFSLHFDIICGLQLYIYCWTDPGQHGIYLLIRLLCTHNACLYVVIIPK